jgi:hypothetical protein
MSEFQVKLEEQQQLQSQEISRHNIAMEHIANNTASIEAKKKELEIIFFTKSAELDNEKKELKVQKFQTYEALKAKGISNERILSMFPSLQEFVEMDKDEDNEKYRR